jgi:cytosine/creatinine deaminase
VGESETFSGAFDFMVSRGVTIVNLNLQECKDLMREFIARNPSLWNEDIGR